MRKKIKNIKHAIKVIELSDFGKTSKLSNFLMNVK